MIANAFQTPKITTASDLYTILDICLPQLQEKSVVAITSKIISICQGNIVTNNGQINKSDLVKKEADYYYVDEQLAKHFGVLLPTITKDILIANAGIDESNSNGDFVLWPRNIQQTCEQIWKYLKDKNKITKLGIIITDSRLVPLRWGTQGVGIAWCGFSPLRDYRGKPDIFGKPLRMTQASVIDGLSASAVLLMGEGDEQTPLVVLSDVQFVTFQNRPPSDKEKNQLRISKEDDIYGKLLTSVTWQSAGKK